ncbi:MAG: protoporphyrinogen oxidase [Geobacter sp.]
MKQAIIIGGGISGLSTAWLLRRQAQADGVPLQITLLEKEPQVGGKIRSIRDNGFTCEWGPNGFLDNKPQTLELCRSLGIDDRLHRSNDNARKRFIYSQGMLHRLPENGPSFLKSKLLSWPGKLRLLGEPFAPPSPAGVDETLADFARRRLGQEALDKLIGPMVSGIFAGNPETMSLVSCFPRIAELEREYGGLFKAMLKLAKKKRQQRAAGQVTASAAGPGGTLTSFREGIQFLTDALRDQLPDVVRSGCEARSVGVEDGRYRVTTEGCGELQADLVIMAAPAYATAALLAPLNPAMASLLEQIPYASLSVICCGYERQRISHPLDGFGYLIARKEGRSTLGTLWDSSMFDNRAPDDMVLLRSMAGGACLPELVNLPDGLLLSRVQDDLRLIMGIEAEPSFVRIFKHQQAIPQYVAGHGKKLAELEGLAASHPGLFLTGNAFRGVGLNDCVASSQLTVERAMRFLQGGTS